MSSFTHINVNNIVSPKFYDALSQLKVMLKLYPNMTMQYFNRMPSMQDLYTFESSSSTILVVMPSQLLLDFLEVMGAYDERVNLSNDRINR